MPFQEHHQHVLCYVRLAFPSPKARVLSCGRVRISLGLKPLSMDNEKDKRQKEAIEREAKRAEEAKEARAAELAERIKAYVPPNNQLSCILML